MIAAYASRGQKIIGNSGSSFSLIIRTTQSSKVMVSRIADIAIDIWSAPTNKSNPTDVTFSRFVLALHIKSVTTR